MDYDAPDAYRNYSTASGEFDDWQYLEDQGFVPVIVPPETPEEYE